MNKAQIDTLNSFEIFGQILGCHGDPVNQDTNDGGIAITTALDALNITSIDTQNQILLWSRILVCELLLPKDVSWYKSNIAIVLRPRNLWLFKSGANYKDFYDNTASQANLKTSMIEIAPKYRIGDVIRIGALPYHITINGWNDGFSTYAAQSLDNTLVCGNIALDNTATNITGRFASVNLNKILFYDKNVDARGRFEGGGGVASPPVWLP